MQLVASTPTPTPASDWVQAAPFRAHVRHVCEASGHPWPVVAMRAGVSLALTDHLLHGRSGRPLRRIARDSAARLLSVTPEVAARVASESVPAEVSQRLAAVLAARSLTPDEVADAAGLERTAVRALHHRPPAYVPRLTELRLRALVAALDRALAARAAA